jgi:hypothetical protein
MRCRNANRCSTERNSFRLAIAAVQNQNLVLHLDDMAGAITEARGEVTTKLQIPSSTSAIAYDR